MMSLHVSDISIMRKRAGCGRLGSSRYTLQWWESRRKGDRGYVCTPCIGNYSLRAEGRKLWNAHRENCTGAVYICVLPWRGINSTSTLLLFGFLQNTESWTRQGRDKCVWKGDNMIRSVLRRQSVFFRVFWGFFVSFSFFGGGGCSVICLNLKKHLSWRGDTKCFQTKGAFSELKKKHTCKHRPALYANRVLSYVGSSN